MYTLVFIHVYNFSSHPTFCEKWPIPIYVGCCEFKTDSSSSTMPVIACPLPGCNYSSDDSEAGVAAALLNLHAHLHSGTTNSNAAKLEKAKRPVITSGGSSGDWAYFESRWKDYVDAIKVAGKGKVVQLLELGRGVEKGSN